PAIHRGPARPRQHPSSPTTHRTVRREQTHRRRARPPRRRHRGPRASLRPTPDTPRTKAPPNPPTAGPFHPPTTLKISDLIILILNGAEHNVRRRVGEYRRRVVAGRGFGVLRGTEDADEIASLGGG